MSPIRIPRGPASVVLSVAVASAPASARPEQSDAAWIEHRSEQLDPHSHGPEQHTGFVGVGAVASLSSGGTVVRPGTGAAEWTGFAPTVIISTRGKDG